MRVLVQAAYMTFLMAVLYLVLFGPRIQNTLYRTLPPEQAFQATQLLKL